MALSTFAETKVDRLPGRNQTTPNNSQTLSLANRIRHARHATRYVHLKKQFTMNQIGFPIKNVGHNEVGK